MDQENNSTPPDNPTPPSAPEPNAAVTPETNVIAQKPWVIGQDAPVVKPQIVEPPQKKANTTQTVILVGLIFAIIGVLISSHFRKMPESNTPSALPAVLSQPVAAISELLTKKPAEPQEKSAPMFTGRLKVHGIMAQDDKRLVLINDQVYEEGDQIHGMKILLIGVDTITVVNAQGEEEILKVTGK